MIYCISFFIFPSVLASGSSVNRRYMKWNRSRWFAFAVSTSLNIPALA